jgi:hypothetical protein
MGRIILLFSLIVVLASPAVMYSATFEELELPPEGSHQGQMLLGVTMSVGMPTGDLIDAEEAFLQNTTYTFDNETTKRVEVTHLAFGVGITFEYMPYDYVGIRTRFRRGVIVQRTNFGTDYKNWREFLYTDYALYAGVAFHATTRKSWDFTLTPLIGYAYYTYHATPVAEKILAGYEGDTKRSGTGLTYGAELNCTMYFSGGLYLAFGFEWIRNPVSISPEYDLTNPQTNARYLEGGTGGTIDSYSFIFTVGYAFAN